MRRLHARVQPLEHRQHQATRRLRVCYDDERSAADRRDEAMPDAELTVILIRYSEPLAAGEPA